VRAWMSLQGWRPAFDQGLFREIGAAVLVSHRRVVSLSRRGGGTLGSRGGELWGVRGGGESARGSGDSFRGCRMAWLGVEERVAASFPDQEDGCSWCIIVTR